MAGTATNRTSTAGAAVSFMPTAAPITAPHQAARPRASSAKVSSMSAAMGRSSPAVDQVSPVSGPATTSCAARTGTRGQRSSRSAMATIATENTANATRASVSGPAPNNALGRPKMAIAGPYGV